MSSPRTNCLWILVSLAAILAVALVFRFGTNILGFDDVRDEDLMFGPIEDILERGWSIETAIDFEETKGPAFIWPYAAAGGLIGGGINDMRLVSLAFFALGGLPLLIIASRCGVRGPGLVAVAGLYALLPYNLVLGQLLMSEPSFVCGSMALMLAFVWGFGESRASERRIAGPILFGLMLAIMLHHRVHAVAYAGAAALVAVERDRFRSWPWWLACALAGASRVPLWVRWGGLVSRDYQDRFGVVTFEHFDLRFEALTYLAAALAPVTAVLIWPVVTQARFRKRMWWVGLGALIGLALGALAQPSLELTYAERFQGIVATTALQLGSPVAQHVFIAVLSTLGVASIGALLVLAWDRPVTESDGQVRRIVFWTTLCGCALYLPTHGYVFDRYVLTWIILLPIVWARTLPLWLLALEALGLLAVAWRFVDTWLVKGGPGA